MPWREQVWCDERDRRIRSHVDSVLSEEFLEEAALGFTTRHGGQSISGGRESKCQSLRDKSKRLSVKEETWEVSWGARTIRALRDEAGIQLHPWGRQEERRGGGLPAGQWCGNFEGWVDEWLSLWRKFVQKVQESHVCPFCLCFFRSHKPFVQPCLARPWPHHCCLLTVAADVTERSPKPNTWWGRGGWRAVGVEGPWSGFCMAGKHLSGMFRSLFLPTLFNTLLLCFKN